MWLWEADVHQFLWELWKELISFACPEIRNVFLFSFLFIKEQLRFMVLYVCMDFYNKIRIVLLCQVCPGFCFQAQHGIVWSATMLMRSLLRCAVTDNVHNNLQV